MENEEKKVEETIEDEVKVNEEKGEKFEFVNETEKSKKEPIKIGLTMAVCGIVLLIVSVLLISFVIGKGITNGPSNLGYGPLEKKPVIYLYPTEKTDIIVKLGNPEKLICSYPKYEGEWNVTANPDGTLVDNKTGRNLYSLYWEGKDAIVTDMKEGFVVKGKDSAKFLEEKLEVLGLNYKEAEEFIVYWLPQLEANKYNYIRFASMEEIEEYMPLEFSKKPDSLIRILMQFKGLDEKIEVKEQKLETPRREGFVAVEWGGTELK